MAKCDVFFFSSVLTGWLERTETIPFDSGENLYILRMGEMRLFYAVYTTHDNSVMCTDKIHVTYIAGTSKK